MFRSQHHLVRGDNELANYATCMEEEVAEITCATVSTALDQFKAVEILSLPNSSARHNIREDLWRGLWLLCLHHPLLSLGLG